MTDLKVVKKVDSSSTFSAQIWTQEWLKAIKENPSIPADEGAMIGWFANAIMTGYDHAYREMAEDNNPLRAID